MEQEKLIGSIIILNWNRAKDLQQLLQSLFLQNLQNWEIIVVDNASDDNSVNLVKAEFPKVKIIELDKNTGVEGFNIGARQSRGGLIFFIDNDMVLQTKDALSKITEKFKVNNRLGALALRVVDFKDGHPTGNNPKHRVEGEPQLGYPASSFDGGGAVFNKEKFIKAGQYDPKFFIYHSEIDLSTRLWNMGYEVRYFEGITVAHKGSKQARLPGLHKKLFIRNGLWYIWKYYPLAMGINESIKLIFHQFVDSLKTMQIIPFLGGLISSLSGIIYVLKYRRKFKVRPEIIEMLEKIRLDDLRRKKEQTGA